MGAKMGVNRDPEWRAAPDLAARLGDEGWPLLDYLLDPPQGAAAAPRRTAAGRDQRRAALEALIEAAFGP